VHVVTDVRRKATLHEGSGSSSRIETMARCSPRSLRGSTDFGRARA
jgi:hypothetical protein